MDSIPSSREPNKSSDLRMFLLGVLSQPCSEELMHTAWQLLCAQLLAVSQFNPFTFIKASMQALSLWPIYNVRCVIWGMQISKSWA